MSAVLPSLSQYVGTWVSGRREGGGELVLGNYSYQGGFTNDLVSVEGHMKGLGR